MRTADSQRNGIHWLRLPGKTPFPRDWSADRVMHEISDVATDPSSIFRTGRGGSTIVTGTRDGVDIRVILRNGDIITDQPAEEPVMSTTDFDELLGRIRGLLVSLGSVLSSEESAEVDELLDHAELGEALRTLTWLIVEEEKQVPNADVSEIDSLAVRMEMSNELPETLSQRGVGDG